jgi:hypothetical protein
MHCFYLIPVFEFLGRIMYHSDFCNNNEILAMTSGMNVCDNVFNLLVK